MEESYKFNLKLVLYISLAFFTAEMAWGLYNTSVNLYLDRLIQSLAIVGILMALDNMIGVVLQPIMGNLSDNTRTKIGRRMPYLIIGIPAAAILFAIIPFYKDNLPLLIFWMALFGIATGFYRSQAVALMPDFIKPEDRSKGNAIINAMAGVGGIIAFILGGISHIITDQGAFIIISILMIIALVILLLKVNENESYSYKSLLAQEKSEGKKIKVQTEKPDLIQSFKEILKEKDKSTIIMLFAICSWFIAFYGLQALLTIYGVHVIQQPENVAKFLFIFIAIPIIVFAYPFAKVADKIGRRNAIKIGLVIMATSLIIGFFLGFSRDKSLIGIILVFFFSGIGWSFINVNSIVIIWQLAPTKEKIGTYTGLYYLFSYTAAIFGPFILGIMTDLTSLPDLEFTLLLNGAIFCIIALILMFFVKRGEVELKTEQKKVIQNL